MIGEVTTPSEATMKNGDMFRIKLHAIPLFQQ